MRKRLNPRMNETPSHKKENDNSWRKTEEGWEHVRPLWFIWFGPHMYYNDPHNTLSKRNLVEYQKWSQCGLRAETRPHEEGFGSNLRQAG
jgi:hypothetical protein